MSYKTRLAWLATALPFIAIIITASVTSGIATGLALLGLFAVFAALAWGVWTLADEYVG